MRLATLYRYPVKGLSPEPLEGVTLGAGCPLPHDRRFAVENGPSGFDPAAPAHLPKIKFLMLMRHESLARLTTRFDERTTVLTVSEGGRTRLEADLSVDEGRAALEGFLTSYMGDAVRGPLRVLEAPGFSFSDTARRVVSIINLATVQDLEARVGAPVDPLRFRGNLQVDELPAWEELSLVGRELASPGGVRLRVVKPIDRCAATNVDPATGLRDLDIPRALLKGYGHDELGVYAEVVAGGELMPGDRLQPL
jgi:uncharacterized protein YcbX